MTSEDSFTDLRYLMSEADARYGDFASTHEALGVAMEEWHELIDAIRANDIGAIQLECMDLAAVLMRLANQLAVDDSAIVKRSLK